MKVMITGGTGTLGGMLVRILERRSVQDIGKMWTHMTDTTETPASFTRICDRASLNWSWFERMKLQLEPDSVRLVDQKRTSVVVFSRDEWKQYRLKKKYPYVTCVLGDVRDEVSVREALIQHEVTHVIHAAALKRVDGIANQPDQVIKTNVLGSSNVVRACRNAGSVKQVLLVSSDKACAPTTSYGKTKSLMEELVGGSSGLEVSAIRYGNVMTSRGAVYHLLWDCAVHNKFFEHTVDLNSTRFFLSVLAAGMWVLKALFRMKGGEIFIPALPSMQLSTLAKVVAEIAYRHTRGRNSSVTAMSNLRIRRAWRPRAWGEKQHEMLLSPTELRCVERYDPWFGGFVLRPTQALNSVAKYADQQYESNHNLFGELELEHARLFVAHCMED